MSNVKIVFVGDKTFLKIGPKKYPIAEGIIVPKELEGQSVSRYESKFINGNDVIIKFLIGDTEYSANVEAPIEDENQSNETEQPTDPKIETETLNGKLIVVQRGERTSYFFRVNRNTQYKIDWRKIPAQFNGMNNADVEAEIVDNEVLKIVFEEKTFIDKIASAPYNFIPLNKTIIAGQEIPYQKINRNGTQEKEIIVFSKYFDEDRYSGYINLSIETKSPLFIGGKNDSFLSVDGYPVLAGSTLRGMIRTLTEIVSFGKFDKKDLERKKIFYRAVADGSSLGNLYKSKFSDETLAGDKTEIKYKIKSGWLQKIGEEYFLSPSQTVSYNLDGDNYSLQYYRVERNYIPVGLNRPVQIYFNNTRVKSKKQKGRFELFYFYIDDMVQTTVGAGSLHMAFLVETGDIDRKHYEWVINPPEDSPINVTDVLKLYEKDKERNTPLDLIKNSRSGIRVPCFYLVEKNRIISIGHTGMHKIDYKSLLENAIDQNPISQPDFAESIFGKENGEAAGRVFFEDGKIKEKDKFDPDHLRQYVLRILGTPKITTFQHYIQQPHEHLTLQKSLHHWDTPSTAIRGRKLYWHRINRPNVTDHWVADTFEIDKEDFLKFLTGTNRWEQYEIFVSNQFFTEEEDNNRREKLVIEGSLSNSHQQFPTFLKILSEFFYLPEAELKRLEITKPQNSLIKPIEGPVVFDSRIRFENLTAEELGCLLFVLKFPPGCCHKLGMGKPLGLGSVEITPTLFITKRAERYKGLFENDKWNTATDMDPAIDNFKNQFARYIDKRLNNKKEVDDTYTANQLWKTPILKELEVMLTFDQKIGIIEWLRATRYMRIDHPENRNEYKDRPVLPNPSEVVKKIK